MKYGISELAIVPVRAEASDKAEMVNQVLFGEHFKVIEYRVKWSKIRLAHDEYEGWICNKQWSEIDKKTYDKLGRHDPTLTTELLDIVLKETHQTVPLGSTLPFYQNHQFQINDNVYSHQGEFTSGIKDKVTIVNNAMLYLNTPYLWGGRSPFGIDCSGFTQMIYRLNGKEIPRDAYQQAEIGTTLSFIDESEAGDLAFFDNHEGKIIHVGIILENNFIIHSSGKVRIDRLDQQGIFNVEERKHTHKLRLIKSII
tara:strand:- start:6516 stop:7280 length:765 start_codon:yes stop_codon:yes gene_type:complete